MISFELFFIRFHGHQRSIRKGERKFEKKNQDLGGRKVRNDLT